MNKKNLPLIIYLSYYLQYVSNGVFKTDENVFPKNCNSSKMKKVLPLIIYLCCYLEYVLMNNFESCLLNF